MSGKTHRMQIGTIACVVLDEGFLVAADYQTSFPNAAVDEMNDALQNHGCDSEYPLFQMNALLIECDGTRILVDTGMGNNDADPNVGHIPAALQSEGISVNDIDIIFITHFHDDHINGLVNNDGQPIYPNSRIVTAQTEWDYWMSEETLHALGEANASYLRKAITPLKDRFQFLNPGDTLAPGITLLDMAGHTPGQCGLLIESQGERLLVVMDLIHSLPQLKYPHWHIVYDTDGELAVHKRKRILAYIAEENLLALFYHLPFPGLGHVIHNADDTFTFLPIEPDSQ